MKHHPASLPSPSEHGIRETNDFVAAEDAALAILRLQLRIIILERDNKLLRNCLPDFASSASNSAAVAKPLYSS